MKVKSDAETGSVLDSDLRSEGQVPAMRLCTLWLSANRQLLTAHAVTWPAAAAWYDMR